MKRLSPSLWLTIFLLLVAFANPVQAKDKWIKVQSKNFTLISNANEKSVRQVATRLEQFRHVFSKLFPNLKFTTPVPTTVVVFKDDKSFSPFNISSNVAGYFQASDDVNYIALSTETNGEQTPYTIIFHEYVHLMVNNNMSDNVPVWFNEGLATYYSTFEIEDDTKITLGKIKNSYLYLLSQERMLPLRTLLTVDHNSPHYNEADKTGIFYAQSWLLMHYLIQNEGGKRLPYFSKFMAGLKSGMALDKAFQDAFQMPVEQMEKELQQYARKPEFMTSVLTSKTKLLFDAEMTSGEISEADSQAYLGDLLVHIRAVSADKYLKKAIELNPNHAMAHASLGMFYARQANFAEARKYLEKAVAVDSQNYLAYYYYAQAISFQNMKQGYVTTTFSSDELKAMRSSLKKAIELSPTFPDSYRLLAFVNLVAQEQIDESIDLLKRAIAISPGKQELNYMLAQCYMAKQDFNSAKQLLEPIVRTTPDADVKSHAESLLNAIKQIEKQKSEYEAFRKQQEEQRKNQSTQQGAVSGGLQNSEIVPDDAPENQPGFQTGLYKVKDGESQVRGQLIRIECPAVNKGTPSVVFVIKVGEKLHKFYKASLANVRLVAFTALPFGGQISCGMAVKDAPEVIATFRPQTDKNAKNDGEIILMEFIPKDYPTQP